MQTADPHERFLYAISEAEADEIVRTRTQDDPRGYRSRAPIRARADLRGALGELATGRFLDRAVDRTLRVGGDGARDFAVPLGIDVKTTEVRHNAQALSLIIPEGRAHAALYIQAGWYPADGLVELLGWAWGWEVRTAWDVGGAELFDSGRRNYYRAVPRLHPMGSLAILLGRREAPDKHGLMDARGERLV